MYSLLLSLQRFAPDVNVGYFASPNRTLEHIHRLAYTKASYLYKAFYNATGHSTVWHKAYFGVTYSSIRSFYSELAPLLGEYDAVISTHFMQTYALLKAKYTLGLATKIIAYVPDFDHSYIHVPCYANLRVDAVLAQGTLLLEQLARLYNFAPERIQRAGFLPRSTFTDVRTLSAAQAASRPGRTTAPPAATRRNPRRLTSAVIPRNSESCMRAVLPPTSLAPSPVTAMFIPGRRYRTPGGQNRRRG